MNSSDQNIALVTGASRGIGRAAALALGTAGYHVIALARTVGALEELDDEIAAAGGSATLIPVDLAEQEALSRLPAALADRFGRIDALVANAGVLGELTPVSDIPAKVWHNAFAVNVHANLSLLAGLDPLLRASSHAHIVGITSGRARKFVPFWAPYSATKAAFEALMLTYAAEQETFTIRTNLIDPGPIRTGMRAKAMPGEDPETLPTPEDLAPLVVELCRPDETRNGEIISFKEWLQANA
ncbi:SDR family NAD(P)-dependent oxidoreductase [Parvularcula sp. LCG005]|uniref:SDR family NAD(P)-dependent oxidoreductase n=1 Tax=Parvularcula sp. LCG005 TaxID=3078805 RepID=UPI00294249B1|nr:SDR family NAD(P)-dependent oxidoreductase [Parvularcula sp. LCG005]WOI52374.1 SDR family NAD(P)-dependent oxidoreductase [Parvularcula sp. LCG005]